MNADPFEQLLRAWPASPSRRYALRLLSAAVLGNLLASGDQAATAKKHKHKKKHPPAPPPLPPASPPSPPPPPTGACQIDADCSGTPNTPVCCNDTGVAACQVCCVADDRGCPDLGIFFCLNGT